MTELEAKFVQEVYKQSRVARYFANYRLGATTEQYRPGEATQSLEYRATNGSYTQEVINPDNLQAAIQKYMGFFVKWDDTFAADAELSIGIQMDRWFDRQVMKRAKATARALDHEFFNGTGVGDAQRGLSVILDGVTPVPGFVGTMVVNANAGRPGNSFDLSDESNWAAFLELWHEWMEEFDFTHVWCSPKFVSRMTTIYTKYHGSVDTEGRDKFNRKITEIDGVILAPMYSSVIGVTEPDDAAVANTTSLYGTVAGEAGHYVHTNSGFQTRDVGQMEGEMNNAFKFEYRWSHVIEEEDCIRRFRNIKL